jgi:hypothetical protein
VKDAACHAQGQDLLPPFDDEAPVPEIVNLILGASHLAQPWRYVSFELSEDPGSSGVSEQSTRACLKGVRVGVVGHKLVTWCVGARNAMRSPVDESTTKKTFLPETSCLPYRWLAGRT